MDVGLSPMKRLRPCYFCTDAGTHQLTGRNTLLWPNKQTIPLCLKCANNIGQQAKEEGA